MADSKRKRKNKERTILCKFCQVEVSTLSNRRKYCDDCASVADWRNNYSNPRFRLVKLVAMAKSRAKAKSIPFDITAEYIFSLWRENNGCCCLTGQEFDLENWGGKSQVNPRSPSIDRIIPKLGYVKGNVRLITYHMNISLSDFGIEEFENLINSYRGVV